MFKTKRKAASLSKPLGASKKPKSAKLPDNPVPAAAGAFPIVGIGASAGGLEAIEQFLKNVPSPSGMAFVIVQHLDPTHKGIMPELLQRMTKMKVFQVKDRMPVRPDCVYVIPPNKDLSILHGVLHLLDPAAPRGLRLPIDFFLRSLAEDQRERGVGVILSGMGSDGTLGLKAIKEQAGVVLVQEPDSAKFDGMPRSAIDAGLADIVAPAEELPARLLEYLRHAPLLTRPTAIEADAAASSQLEKILLLLRGQTGHDFSLYKRNTLYRRIERRMGLHQIGKLSHYVRYLRENPQEGDLLFKELLIGVTSFFREPAAWAQLRDELLPPLLAGRQDGSTLRAWVAGCSTGEEAYTLAIVFKEALEQLKPRAHLSLQIFATDIDRDAVDRARQGFYPASIAADVSPERRRRFFRKEAHGYRVAKEIRELVVFAPQSLILEPPFTKLDLLTCRNLLIYLTPELQKKVFPLFHYSLNPGGVLLLGSAETATGFAELFTPCAGRNQFYHRNQSVPTAGLLNFPAPFSKPPLAAPRLAGQEMPPSPPKLQELAEQWLLQTQSPAAVLVNDAGDILFISGRTGRYLEPAAGKANWNLFVMAPESLRLPLTAAFAKARRQKTPVPVRSLPVGENGGRHFVDLTVTFLQQPEALRGLAMIVFTEVIALLPAAKTKGGKPVPPGRRVRELEQELQQTREEVQNTREEMQTSQEELKSINEEMQSTNEELQSMNEELNTSKEEMQSLNEELQTVNAELQSKVEDLSTASNDMKNLLNSTEIATLFLDGELRVRRFTEQATKIIKLIPGDVGRPVTDLASDLIYPELAADAREVLRMLVPVEKPLTTRDDRWFAMRLMPYRTLDDRIDGVVITFADITKTKRKEAALAKANDLLRLAVVVRDSHDAITVQDLEGRIIAWNPGAVRLYGWSEAEALAMNVRDRILPAEREHALAKLVQLSRAEILAPYPTRRLAKDGSVREVSIISTALVNEAGQMYAIATTERAQEISIVQTN